MRGGGSILRWQQGAPRGPSKAASRITSSSFSHSLKAPVEGIIRSLSLSAGQTVKKFFAKSYLGIEILCLPWIIAPHNDSQSVNAFYISRGP